MKAYCIKRVKVSASRHCGASAVDKKRRLCNMYREEKAKKIKIGLGGGNYISDVTKYYSLVCHQHNISLSCSMARG